MLDVMWCPEDCGNARRKPRKGCENLVAAVPALLGVYLFVSFAETGASVSRGVVVGLTPRTFVVGSSRASGKVRFLRSSKLSRQFSHGFPCRTLTGLRLTC